MDRNFYSVFLFVTSVKILFIPLYYSTDFEVHRNWKAITHSTNYKNWYYESLSEWTLDYPPFFAWFEYCWSQVAKYFDVKMLDIRNLDYTSKKTVVFMRLSVILSDIVYTIAIGKIYNLLKKQQQKSDDPWVKAEVIFAMLMLWNPGLLMVDHIHFQYNGFLNGFLFLSLAAMMQEKYVQAAFWYCVLLNFKHLYLYFAPAYFIFLLKNYCFKHGSVEVENFSFRRFFTLSSVVAGVFLLSFGPFILADQMKQVINQIFPVQRGLTHAYWAPNVWALYNGIDRILVLIANAFGFHNSYSHSSITKGLVQQSEHSILPSIGIKTSIILTLLAICPFLWNLWKKPKNAHYFIESIIGCAFGSFLFGYHVHEKAILMMTLPLTLIALNEPRMMSTYVLLSSIGHFSLFPLLHHAGETPLKLIILVMHSVYSYTSLKRLWYSFNRHVSKYEGKEVTGNVFTPIETILLIGIPAVQVFYSFGMKLLHLEDRLPFLPLMIISMFCAVGIIYCWGKYCKLCLLSK